MGLVYLADIVSNGYNKLENKLPVKYLANYTPYTCGYWH
jgi:hypothetical protein